MRTVKFGGNALDLVDVWVLQVLPDNDVGKFVAVARLTLCAGGGWWRTARERVSVHNAPCHRAPQQFCHRLMQCCAA